MPKSERRLRRQYDCLYRMKPIAANLFLLLVKFGNDQQTHHVNTDEELMDLMTAKFGDPAAYAFMRQKENG